MKEWKNSRAAKLVALATLLWLTAGIHLIHPLLHEHGRYQELSELGAGREVLQTPPSVSGVIASAVCDDDDHDCWICNFLFTFHAQNSAPQPALISSDVLAAVPPPLAFLPPSQSCRSPFSARAPPF